MKKNVGKIAVCAAATLFALLLIAFLRIPNHGYYCDEFPIYAINDAGGLETVSLAGEGCTVTFSPQKPYFKGFELFLAEKPAEEGLLLLTVSDQSGKQIGREEIPLDSIKAGSWYKVICDTARGGGIYTLSIQFAGSGEAPKLFRTDAELLPGEQVAGNTVIGYAYGEQTFSDAERVILTMFILSFWGAAMWVFAAGREKKYAFVKITSILLFLTAVLTWNYMFNTMNQNNTNFAGFQADSEALVTGAIAAERDGLYKEGEKESRYGLGKYTSLTAASDTDWVKDGYSRTKPLLLVNRNFITENIAVAGNSVRFANGEEFTITEITEYEGCLELVLDAPEVLFSEKYGSLEDAVYLNAEHQELPKSQLEHYISQYGLQGKLFRFLARYLKKDIPDLRLICAVCAALVFSVITWMLFCKYNALMACCFYITFWLSPWVVNFARNLYWVEFTWFIPMAIGLLCAWKIEKKWIRRCCYFAAWIAVMAKCLCGYEYISTIMMGLVTFPFVDFLVACVGKKRKRARMLFTAVFVLSIAAVAGFAMAFCIHAGLRGSGTGLGSLIDGIQRIVKDDVLRRTSGADQNTVRAAYISSLNASVWQALCKYFHFSTDVITGISGNLFPLLCLTPLGIFVYEYKKGKIDFEMISIYVFSFLASTSWFCLAKAHSYIHTHMNFVMWYFGFVQICLYLPVSRVYKAFRSRRNEPEKRPGEEESV